MVALSAQITKTGTPQDWGAPNIALQVRLISEILSLAHHYGDYDLR